MDLEENQWNDLNEILQEFIAVPEVQVSSEALKAFTAIYQKFPERMKEQDITPEALAKYNLGKLFS